jgi:hypothetical protein
MLGLKMINAKRKIAIGLIAFSVIGLGGCTFSDGQRAGTISKFSHKGLICKSWEGEMVMGGMRNQDDRNGFNSSVPNVFQFSVTDPQIVPQIEAKLLSGDRAVLHYNQKILPPFCWRRTEYVIKSVQ